MTHTPPPRAESCSRGRRAGSSLTELLIALAILSVLAGLALPAFAAYLKRVKTSEAHTNLGNLFKLGVTYYSMEFSGDDLGGRVASACTVPTFTPPDTLAPSDKRIKTDAYRQPGSATAALGFTLADYAYYVYSIPAATRGGACGNLPGPIYTFRAEGDLDADGLRSTFDMAVVADSDNQLYHAGGFHVLSELE